MIIVDTKMKVYCVMKLDDYEYGHRSIESIWTTCERAEAHIKKLGQELIKFRTGARTGATVYLYTVQEYQVQGLQKE